MRIGQRGALMVVGLCLAVVGLVALSGRTGGPVTWVVTAGTSMTPEIQPGTLVVVQRRASYEVGDVVAYRSSQLGQTVLHRVVEVGQDGKLVLKGDANSWIDPVTPTQSEIVGERAIQVPGAGRVLSALKSPLMLGLGAGLVGLLLLPRGDSRRGRSARTGRSSWRLGRHRGEQAPVGSFFDMPMTGPTWEPDPEPQPPTATPARQRVPALSGAHDDGFLALPSPLRASPAVEAAVAVTAGGCLLLGVLATAGPFVRQESSPRMAAHAVTWSYDADAKPGVVYPDGIARTGDPLYHRLVSAADVAAQLHLTAPPGAQLSGSWRLAVTVSDESGWKRQTYLGRDTPVGSAPRLTVRVPTLDLLALAKRASQESGVESAARKLTVQALLDLSLTAEGTSTSVTAAPALDFTLDERQVRLADPTQLEQRGELSLPAAVIPKEFALLGVSLPAGQVRLAALAGGLLSLLLLALLRGGRRNEDEDARITRTYGQLLVEMHDLDEPKRTVDVRSFDALAAIAARYERMVLFGDCDGLRVYLVLEDGVAYRYYSAEVAAALATPAKAAPIGQSWTIPQQRQPEPEPARRR